MNHLIVSINYMDWKREKPKLNVLKENMGFMGRILVLG